MDKAIPIRTMLLLGISLLGGTALLAGCSSQPPATTPIPTTTATLPPADTALPADQIASLPPPPTQVPQAAASPAAFQPYTIVKQLPPKPAHVSHHRRKLHLALHRGHYFLADDDNHYYDVGRDSSGHVYPAYSDSYTHQEYPLYYDPDRDDYYHVARDEDDGYYYRTYQDDRYHRCYIDHRDYDYYRPNDYERPIVYTSAPAYHDPNRDAWLLAIPILVAAYFLLRPVHHHASYPAYQTPAVVRYVPVPVYPRYRPGLYTPGQNGYGPQRPRIVINNINNNRVIVNNIQRTAVQSPGRRFVPPLNRPSAAPVNFSRAAFPTPLPHTQTRSAAFARPNNRSVTIAHPANHIHPTKHQGPLVAHAVPPMSPHFAAAPRHRMTRATANPTIPTPTAPAHHHVNVQRTAVPAHPAAPHFTPHPTAVTRQPGAHSREQHGEHHRTIALPPPTHAHAPMHHLVATPVVRHTQHPPVTSAPYRMYPHANVAPHGSFSHGNGPPPTVHHAAVIHNAPPAHHGEPGGNPHRSGEQHAAKHANHKEKHHN